MFLATMHRVYFSHLEVPADFARKKKKRKVYLELDIKGQFEGGGGTCIFHYLEI